MDVADAQKLKGLEAENAKLKRLLADAMLDNAALKDLLGKNGDARTSARSRLEELRTPAPRPTAHGIGPRRPTHSQPFPLSPARACGGDWRSLRKGNELG